MWLSFDEDANSVHCLKEMVHVLECATDSAVLSAFLMACLGP